jgi:hypothetical protein
MSEKQDRDHIEASLIEESSEGSMILVSHQVWNELTNSW